jgi:hypothetical protein
MNAPNEVWMRIFSYTTDARTLMAIILTSRRFHDLGLQDLARTLVWKTQEKAEANIEFWGGNTDWWRIPRALHLNANLPATLFMGGRYGMLPIAIRAWEDPY